MDSAGQSLRPSPSRMTHPRTARATLALAGLLAACGRPAPTPMTTSSHDPPPATKPLQPSPPPRPSQPELALADVAAYPLPGMIAPTAVAFTPDDGALSYLRSPDRSLVRQLYRFDLAHQTGDAAGETLLVTPPGGGITEDNLSLEEKLQRERQRVRELGITSYAWSKTGGRLMIPLTGEIFAQQGEQGPLTRLVAADGKPALAPQLSRDGSKIAYVQDAELYVVDADGGAPSQRTKGARGTGKTHGLAEYIAQEEMHRNHGFWWSRDGAHLAFEEVDETHIPIYRIVHQGKDAVGEAAQEDHAYPFAGAANAKIRLGVVASSGSDRVTWMDLGDDPEQYLARVQWLPDGTLSAQVTDRPQQRLKLLKLDPRTGESTTLLEESSDIWINLHDMHKPIAEGPFAGHFVWSSERSGFRHLYLYKDDGTLVRGLTDGAWQVDAIADIDEERGLVYFTGNREHPAETHVYVVSLAGGEVRRLSDAPGSHGIVVDRAQRRWVNTFSDLTTPPKQTLRSLDDGALIREVPQAPDPRLQDLHLPPPELTTFKNRHGDTLHIAIYRPDADATRNGAPAGPPYPTIVSVYGGPHAQRVVNSWGTTVDMHAQALRSRGYLVVKIDNRGSARRGLAFEGIIKNDLGHFEVDDQVDGVRWLVEQGLTDPQRVGIHGWSYGGYMAAMALVRAPETFQLGIAGAPVTHWDGYDTHYTERYMGTPQSNPRGYAESSVMHHVDKLTGKLLLVHGMIDENVHFRHTARLINALIRAGKPYELLLFPDERHMPRRLEDRVHMEQQILDFIARSL
jgi:dipeptidyl-peptidase-4